MMKDAYLHTHTRVDLFSLKTLLNFHKAIYFDKTADVIISQTFLAIREAETYYFNVNHTSPFC